MESNLIKIKITRKNKKIILLALPVVFITIILFLLPRETLENLKKSRNSLKYFLRDLKTRGSGTKILIDEPDRKITITFK